MAIRGIRRGRGSCLEMARAWRYSGTVAWQLAVVATVLAALPLAAQSGEEVGLAVGTPAPDAVVLDLDGEAHSLLDLIGGGPAILNFWASWCENCEALEPQMQEIHSRFGDRIAVVAVAVAVAQSMRRVRRHVERHESPYRFVYDADGEAVRAYEALTTSIVVVVDHDGRIASTGVGPGQDLVGRVESMLGVNAASSPGRP